MMAPCGSGSHRNCLIEWQDSVTQWQDSVTQFRSWNHCAGRRQLPPAAPGLPSCAYVTSALWVILRSLLG